MEVDDFKGRNNTKKYKTRKCKKDTTEYIM